MTIKSGKQSTGTRPETKRTEAAERNAAWSELSPQKQLAELDRRLGTNVGAKRQRARLARAARTS